MRAQASRGRAHLRAAWSRSLSRGPGRFDRPNAYGGSVLREAGVAVNLGKLVFEIAFGGFVGALRTALDDLAVHATLGRLVVRASGYRPVRGHGSP